MCLSESLRLFAPSQSHLPVDSSFSLMIFLLAFTGFTISCCSFPPSPFIFHCVLYSSWPLPSLLYYLHLINGLVCSTASPPTHPVCFLFMSIFFIPSVITIIMLLSCHCPSPPVWSVILFHPIIMLSSCTFSKVLAVLSSCLSHTRPFFKFKGINHQSDAWLPVFLQSYYT